MASIFIRTILMYLILICTLRISGKRQIGEMQISELVTTFLLSELASVPLTSPSTPLLLAVIPVFTIVFAEIILSFLTTKSALMKKLLDGNPGMIIRRGVLQKKEMETLRLSLDDLMQELRLKDIASLSDVEYAILESNGKISVFPKNKAPLSHVLVIDGAIQKNVLPEAGRSETWIHSVLKEHNISDMREVFLLSATDDGTLTLIKKGDLT